MKHLLQQMFLPLARVATPRSTRPAARRRDSRAAFTLIELLVVIALMAMLMTLLGGGIRRSVENAKKRQASTAKQAVQTAILTFWHDTGKPPIETQKGYYTYIYDWAGGSEGSNAKTGVKRITSKSVTDVLRPLTETDHRLNVMNKSYLSSSDKYVKHITRITFDLTAKNATVE